MLIVGFDPGSISCGVGIVKKEGKKITYIYSEEVKLTEPDLMNRMRLLWEKIKEINGSWEIGEAAIEDGFTGKNVRSANVLDKIRGIILASLFEKGAGVCFYSPREVKQFVTGNGNALKSQVKKMVGILLSIPGRNLGDDESDALAVAYCHGMKLK